MKQTCKQLLALLLAAFLLLTGCSAEVVWEDGGSAGTAQTAQMPETDTADDTGAAIDEAGSYTAKDEVAAYLAEYGHLPDNFITKAEARELGWDSAKGNLGEVAPGKSIGGDYFGNYEGILPEKNGREYHECDIDSTGGYRGAKRIVFSNDGLIYYTEDHYETFDLLYGEEES